MAKNYFSRKEFESKDGQPSPFPNVVVDELIDLLNLIRERFNKPILVTSAYRSPEHNKAVGGVSNSQHVQGKAADIRPLKLKDLSDLQAICLDLNRNGGVGLYNTFCHVDVRGTKARWDNRS